MSCSHFLQSCCLVHTLGYIACTILSACSGGEKSGCETNQYISIAGGRAIGRENRNWLREVNTRLWGNCLMFSETGILNDESRCCTVALSLQDDWQYFSFVSQFVQFNMHIGVICKYVPAFTTTTSCRI